MRGIVALHAREVISAATIRDPVPRRPTRASSSRSTRSVRRRPASTWMKCGIAPHQRVTLPRLGAPLNQQRTGTAVGGVGGVLEALAVNQAEAGQPPRQLLQEYAQL